MSCFNRRKNVLFCEEVPLPLLAEKYGTPIYVYSHESIVANFKDLESAFGKTRNIICYSVKANSNRAILGALAKIGAGADIVSDGELFRALKAGFSPRKIVFSGVGKTVTEMENALKANILMFNVESFSELETLNHTAGRLGVSARVALRVNPEVFSETHPYIATGLKGTKFGIQMDYAIEGYMRAAKLPNIEIVGVDCHIGSQLSELTPFVEATNKMVALIADLRSLNMDIHYLDLGGGFGIAYDRETPPTAAELGDAITEILDGIGVTLLLEPGRSIVGNAGVLLTKVLYTKRAAGKHYAIVDAGMNDLMRPSLYGSYHEVVPATEEGREIETMDIVGPICESGDFLARAREMPSCRAGDLLTVMGSGAYGFSMASTYNSRPLIAEVLVKGKDFALIRERDTVEDLVRNEKVPAWEKG